MSKIFTLIIDDEEASKILAIIDQSVLEGHYEFDICQCVKSIPASLQKLNPKVAVDFIQERFEKKLPIDFAFVDVEFEEEYIDDSGAYIVISKLQEVFPNCRIIVLSKNAGKYPSRTRPYNGIHYPTIKKTIDQVYHKAIIKEELEVWTKLKCAEISADDMALDSLRNALNNSEFSLNQEVVIANKGWKLFDLFVFYITDGCNTPNGISGKITEYLFKFPKFETKTNNGKPFNRWNDLEDSDTRIFSLPLKEYYFELYIFKRGELDGIHEQSVKMFELLSKIYITAILNKPLLLPPLLDELDKYRNNIKLIGDVGGRDNGKFPLTTTDAFNDKLILRNVVVSSYMILLMTVKSIVFLITEHDHFASGNDTKHINRYLFLFGLKAEKISKIEKLFHDFSKPKNRVDEFPELLPKKRGYEKIYKSLSGEELLFLHEAVKILNQEINNKDLTEHERNVLNEHYKNNFNEFNRILAAYPDL